MSLVHGRISFVPLNMSANGLTGLQRSFPSCEGMWLSGRASASHAEGPGFNPRHLQDVLRRWCSGIMQDSHSCDPGSIPGGAHLFASNFENTRTK